MSLLRPWPYGAGVVSPHQSLDYIAPQGRGSNNGHKGEESMASSVNAGARLDRLPISSFHYRIFWLVGAGMFFDGYDLYVAGGVLASTIQTKFSTRSAEPSVPVAHLRRHDHRRAGHRISRRQFRPPLHLSDQFADLRARLARGRVRAEHDRTDLVPLRAGARTRRRDRGRLFDADRIRAAEDARALAVVHGLPRGRRFSG